MKKITMKKNINTTIEEGFKIFLNEHCVLNNMRPSTITYYRELMYYGFFKFINKEMSLNYLTQQDLDNYVVYLKNKDVKDTTINVHLKGLRCVMNFFKNKKWIDNNIKINLIKEDKQQVVPYSNEEIQKLLKKPNMNQCSFAEYRNWVIVNFLCNTGCRRSSLVNIHVEDLDLVNGYCKFRHTKNRKPLTVPITTTMVNILKEYVEYLPKECEYLFPTVECEQITPRRLSKIIEKYNHNRGVQTTGVHKFRHWFAKTAVLNGMDLITLQNILGHSNLEVLKNYVNLLTKDLQYNAVELNPLESIKKENKHIKLK